MTTPARVAAAAVIGVLAIGGALFMLGRPGQPAVGGPGPSPTPAIVRRPSTSPTAPAPSTVSAARRALGRQSCPMARWPRTYVVDTVRTGTVSMAGPARRRRSPDAAESADDSIRVTLTVPDGWAADRYRASGSAAEQNSAPAGAAIAFSRRRLAASPIRA